MRLRCPGARAAGNVAGTVGWNLGVTNPFSASPRCRPGRSGGCCANWCHPTQLAGLDVPVAVCGVAWDRNLFLVSGCRHGAAVRVDRLLVVGIAPSWSMPAMPRTASGFRLAGSSIGGGSWKWRAASSGPNFGATGSVWSQKAAWSLIELSGQGRRVEWGRYVRPELRQCWPGDPDGAAHGGACSPAGPRGAGQDWLI